jgi:transcriptional regulator with XRE-family HTH domain
MEVIIMMDSDLGAKVKKLRISHGLTQEDVAKALDVTPGYISNVENGRNLMTLRMLSYYAELTGVSLDYLAGSVDKTYQNTALDNEITSILNKLNSEQKEKVIATLRLWFGNQNA